MIIDVEKFISTSQPHWKELEKMLERISRGGRGNLEIKDIKRLHYLYGKVSEDLVRISTFSGEREIRRYLENLVSRSYSLIHDSDRKVVSFSIRRFIFVDFPMAFRRNIAAFWIIFAVNLAGCSFGFIATALHPNAKEAILPGGFQHLQGSPEQRVEMEENNPSNALSSSHSYFASCLMTNNIKVAILGFTLGITFGIGTILVEFYNAVILGSVFSDYMLSGFSLFVLGWLLPHGTIEIPAFLISGQAGLMMGNALLKPGRLGRLASLKARAQDITTLIFGVAIMLVWAGIVESFFSQYHWPVLPYWLKISFGVIEMCLLIYYLAFCGMNTEETKTGDGSGNTNG